MALQNAFGLELASATASGASCASVRTVRVRRTQWLISRAKRSTSDSGGGSYFKCAVKLRQQMEMAAVRLAVERASDEDLQELERFAHKSAEEQPERTPEQAIALDEECHERLVTLTGNMQTGNSCRT